MNKQRSQMTTQKPVDLLQSKQQFSPMQMGQPSRFDEDGDKPADLRKP